MQLRRPLPLLVQLRTARRALGATHGSGAVLSAPLGIIGASMLAMRRARRCLRSRRPRRGAATQRQPRAPRAARRSRSRRASGRARLARPRARWCWSARRRATRRAPPAPRPSARGRRSAWACRAGGAASRCPRTCVGARARRPWRSTPAGASQARRAARRRRRRSPSRAGTTTARREPLASGLGKQPRKQCAARPGGIGIPAQQAEPLLGASPRRLRSTALTTLCQRGGDRAHHQLPGGLLHQQHFKQSTTIGAAPVRQPQRSLLQPAWRCICDASVSIDDILLRNHVEYATREEACAVGLSSPSQVVSPLPPDPQC